MGWEGVGNTSILIHAHPGPAGVHLPSVISQNFTDPFSCLYREGTLYL